MKNFYNSGLILEGLYDIGYNNYDINSIRLISNIIKI